MQPRTAVVLFILSCWWIVSSGVAYPPPDPGLKPRGLLSSNEYFVKQATDAITILTLDGSTRVELKTPGRYIFQPNMSWRSRERLYCLTPGKRDGSPRHRGDVLGPYSLICADLVSGATRIVASLDTGPSIYYLVVEKEGFDFVSRFGGISLWSSGKEQPIREGTEGRVWDLQLDKEAGKLLWLSSTDPGISHASDVIEPIRELRVNEYDLAARRTRTTLIDLHRFHREMIHPSLYRQDGPNWMFFVTVQGFQWYWYSAGNTLKDWLRLSQPTRFAPPHDTWLIAYDTRTGKFRKAHTFKNRTHIYGKSPWIIEGRSLKEDEVFLYKWKTSERVPLPEGEIYGFETNTNDDPTVLTDKHVYIYDKDSMEIKNCFDTPLSSD